MGLEATTVIPKFTYERHRPEATTLYKIVQESLATFLQQFEEETGNPLPDFVVKEFREYLRCGILAHGFLRNRCEKCNKEHLVAFSCKRRGFCPSCGTRRMYETAIHMVKAVFPHKPVRQWVATFPMQLRVLLAVRPEIMARCLAITHQTVGAYYRKKAEAEVLRGAGTTTDGKKAKCQTGAVTLIQRFGGSINLNVHFHQLYIDGVYELGDNNEPVGFRMASAPTPRELEEVLTKIIKRITRFLERKGIIVRDEEDNPQVVMEDADVFSKLQATAATYRFLTGPNKGKKALVLKTLPDQDHSATRGLVAKHSGFSLHAGVACRGDERPKLERIARYIARPAIAEDRLSINDKGQVVYRLKRPYDDGTTHIVMEPMELLEKIAAIIPRPRVHLTRFFGVLAPHYKYRKQIVPKSEVAGLSEADQVAAEEGETSKNRINWARLLKRVFNVDVETCPSCGGKMRIIASIEDPKVIKKILSHLGLPISAPPMAPARGPPSLWNDTQEFTFEE